MVSREAYDALVLERPRKFSVKDVGYEQAPQGSVLACHSCIHYFRRAVDALTTCEIFRSPETDKDGVKPDWRCRFFTCDGDVFPFLEEEKEPEKEKVLRDGWGNE